MKQSKQRFQAYVEDALFYKCKKYCHENDVSMSCFIEQLLSDYFNDSNSDSNSSSNNFDIETEVNKLLDSKLSPLIDRLDKLENQMMLKLDVESELESELESDVELEAESDVELEAELELESELSSVPPNCPRGTKTTLVAEFLQSGELIGYFAKGGKIILDPSKAQVYKRFDSAERAIGKIVVYFPNRLFRILDAREIQKD